MRVKTPVKLKPKKQNISEQLISKGTEIARKITRCRILLLANEGKTDTQIIESLHVARNTVRQVRSRYVHNGLEAAISEQSRSGAPQRISGRQKAKITALACSDPPEGRSRWTLRLIAAKAVELELVDTVSHQTVKRILKKTNSSRT